MKSASHALSSERLILKKIVDSDIDNIFLGLSNSLVIEHYGVSYDSLESTRTQMNWFADDKQFWWSICSADDRRFMGAGGFNDISLENKKAEIGLWLLPEYWGKGIMKEAMNLICTYGFSEIGLHRIEGFVDSMNMKCKNGLKKLDFNYEGTMRDSEFKDGKFLSVDIYANINDK